MIASRGSSKLARVRLCTGLCLLAFAAGVRGEVTIEWVTVGDENNLPDPLNEASIPGIGSVSSTFRIAKYEVTNAQFAEFLNAVASSDPNGLYVSSSRIRRSGESGRYAYAPRDGAENLPVTWMSWSSAARFANWLNNGQRHGSTETGAYDMSEAVPLRLPGARVFLPNESEWYKAAYHDPRRSASGGPSGDDHYWLYPTQSDVTPTAEAPPGSENSANFFSNPFDSGRESEVGAYMRTTSFYGVSDMGGNLWEWIEPAGGFVPPDRSLRGGAWNLSATYMKSSQVFLVNPELEGYRPVAGFRVASLPDVKLIDPDTIGVEAGSTYDDSGRFDAANLLDGKADEGNRGTHWIAGEGTLTETLTFDLGGYQDLAQLEILNTSNSGLNDSETDTFTLSFSKDDGSSFSEPSAPMALRGYSEWFQQFKVVETGVTHVRIEVTNRKDDNQAPSEVSVGLNEVRFFTGVDSDPAVTIEWVTVGNENNPPDPLNRKTAPGIGSVNYPYRISRYKVTNAQYAEFLNAMAASSDPKGLWNVRMPIRRGGEPGNFSYAPRDGAEEEPVVYVSWNDAARFANWLHNGQGFTETGAYDMSLATPERLPGARVFLPSENEWYKASYYDPRGSAAGGPPGDDNYWLYPTQSDVSAHVGSTSFYGLSNIPGTVGEWNERVIPSQWPSWYPGAWEPGHRGIRGQRSGIGSLALESSFAGGFVGVFSPPRFDLSDTGFRVASLAEPTLIASDSIDVEAGSIFDDSGRFDAENLLDGETDEGNRDVHFGTHWIARAGRFTETVTFDLGGSHELAQLKILNTSNSGWNDSETDLFTVSLSKDNGASFSEPTAPMTLKNYSEGFQRLWVVVAGVTHVRLALTNDRVDGEGDNMGVGLNEVQFFTGADTDSDGMLDSWEVEQFGDLSRDGTEDEDQPTPDGLSNKEEHDNETDPEIADTDADTLTDYEEVHTHDTSPILADTDRDGQGDGYEVAMGLDPNDAASKSEVLVTTARFGGAQDKVLDFEGDFLYAVNVSSLGEVGRIGDAFFTGDEQTDGFAIDAESDMANWSSEMNFGDGEDNDNLEKVMWGIRWTRRPGGITFTMKDLEVGRRYKLQTLHAERCCDRGWDTFINGVLVLNDFNPGRLQSGDLESPRDGDAGPDSGTVATFDFVAASSTLVVELNGTDVPFPDGNAILSGVTLEALFSSREKVIFEWATVRHENNAPNPANSMGRVSSSYRISKHEVTNGQYAQFLNAVAGTNRYDLWNAEMNIIRSGVSGGFTYAPAVGAKNQPVVHVSWFDAARFANWLHNGQGPGGTEGGAYEPRRSPARLPGARVFLPSQREWYKAALYDPRNSEDGGPPGDDHYWESPTQSDRPTERERPPGGANSANYGSDAVGQVTDVGAYFGTTSYYGAFDMLGNVEEWTDSPAHPQNYAVLGGSWSRVLPPNVWSSQWLILSGGANPDRENSSIGFRVASLPEPTLIISDTISVEAGSTFDNSGTFDAENLLDGETEEMSAFPSGTHWAAREGRFTETVTFDLGGSYNLAQLRILNTSSSGRNDFETDTFTLSLSKDNGANFSPPSAPITLKNYSEGFQRVWFIAAGVTHVRFVVSNDNFDDQGTDDRGVGLNEVQFLTGADSDSDEMLDSWEIEHFGDLSRDGTEDQDQPTPDGLSNKEEHDNETDPQVADTDGDTLTDFDEVNSYNTDPIFADTDMDGQGDGLEVALGSDPRDSASKADILVTTARFENAQDDALDLEGEFLYAVNASSFGEVGQIGDAFFTDDQRTDGFTIDAANEFANWGREMSFGGGEDNDNLAKVMWGIRWTRRPGGVTFTMENLEVGSRYRLQTLHAERCCDRGWDTFINGVRVLNDFNPGRLQSGNLDSPRDGDAGNGSGAVVAIEFVANSSTITVELSGNNVPFPDGNAILNGVTLEALPSSEPFRITSIQRQVGGVTLTWNSSLGLEYSVEYTADLADANWQVLGDGIPAGGAETSFTDDSIARVGEEVGWYRVRAN